MQEMMAKKGPVAKSRVGKFQVSVWARSKLCSARSDFEAEREIQVVRICVQHSRYDWKTRQWANQSIWCQPDELRDLADALDQLGEEYCVKDAP